MKKIFSYAFSGVQIVSLWRKTTLSLYHTSLTLSYRRLVYRIENKNPWIKRGSCCNCHNFVRFNLMKNTTWSWISFFKRTKFLRLAALRLRKNQQKLIKPMFAATFALFLYISRSNALRSNNKFKNYWVLGVAILIA